LSKELKTCKHCHNYFKIDSPQFLINLVITEEYKKNKNKEILENLQEEINEVSEIKWCICSESLEEKEKYIKDFEKSLEEEKVNNKIGLGFDFGLNKNIIYYKTKEEKGYDKITFLSFLKKLKNNLKNGNYDFDFEYIDCSRLEEIESKDIRRLKTETKFIVFYGMQHYMSNGAELKLFNEIITTRLVNGKKNFVFCDTHQTLGQLFKEIDIGLYKNQKYLLKDTENLINSGNGFITRRLATAITKKGESIIITSSPRGGTKEEGNMLDC